RALRRRRKQFPELPQRAQRRPQREGRRERKLLGQRLHGPGIGLVRIDRSRRARRRRNGYPRRPWRRRDWSGSPPPQVAEEVTLEGTIERITFENAATGFRVLKVRTADGIVPVVGTFPSVPVGARVRIRGKLELDRKHGSQLHAESVTEIAHATAHGLVKYLGSGAIKGIGPKTAQRIVDTFGLETMKVLDETPERLLEVSGLGKKKAAEVQRLWAEQKGVREIMVFLQAHGATPALA